MGLKLARFDSSSEELVTKDWILCGKVEPVRSLTEALHAGAYASARSWQAPSALTYR